MAAQNQSLLAGLHRLDGNRRRRRPSSPAAQLPGVGATENGVVSYLAAIEHELQDTLGYHPDSASDYWLMLYYHMSWEDGGEGPPAAGKRTRPLVTLLCATAGGGEWKAALPLAASVELVHSFSLIHDDIQDGSHVRRGRPALWVKWGHAQAINAGDVLFSFAHLAVHRATRLPAEVRLEALWLLGQACVALSRGQFLDILFETRPLASVAEYVQMIEGKTASLFATAAELGALAAKTPQSARAHYRAFGRHLGLAFQIHDDLLGIWGDPELTGKPAASDIQSRKKTLPVVYGMARCPVLREAYRPVDDGGADVSHIVQLLEASGARAFAEAEERRHASLALQHLTDAQPQGEAGEVLRELTLGLLQRAR